MLLVTLKYILHSVSNLFLARQWIITKNRSDSYFGSDKVKCLHLCKNGRAFRQQGNCPVLEDDQAPENRQDQACTDTCSRDNECPSRMKCYSTKCGKECVLAECELLIEILKLKSFQFSTC